MVADARSKGVGSHVSHRQRTAVSPRRTQRISSKPSNNFVSRHPTCSEKFSSSMLSKGGPLFWIFLGMFMVLASVSLTQSMKTETKTMFLNEEKYGDTSLYSGELAPVKKSKMLCDLNISTEDLHRLKEGELFGPFASVRKELDYSYHSIYTKSRQALQNSIIDSFLESTSVAHSKIGLNYTYPWVVFTAGVMGAGKSHTIKLLDQKGRFPLHTFVSVDPDRIRHLFPEWDHYVKHCPQKAGELTGKEAGMLSEILTEAALRKGQNVLVDGTLGNHTFYSSYFSKLRRGYPGLKIAILHITAPREKVFSRVLSRARVSGRVVPQHVLERAMLQIPESLAHLRPEADFTIDLHNSGTDGEDVTILNPGSQINWTVFQNLWIEQECSLSSLPSSSSLLAN